MPVGVPMEQFQAREQTPKRVQGRGEEGLVYLSRPGHGVDAVVLLEEGWRFDSSLPLPLPLLFFLPVVVILLLFQRKPALKLVGSTGAKVVAAAYHVGSVCVVGWVERGEEGEHFRRVTAAAEDDEEVCWGAAFAGRGTAAVEGGEDVEETELWGGMVS